MMSKEKSTVKHIISLIAGPLVFLIISMQEIEGLEPAAVTALGVYAWLIIWWCAEPMPWFATSLVPLVILPLTGVMALAEVTSVVYGQRIFFLLMFVFLSGKPIERSGLGKRIAMSMLSIKWIKGSIHKLAFVFIIASLLLNALFGMVGTIIIIPIAVSVIDYMVAEYKKEGVNADEKKIGAYIVLSAAYGSIAGGITTMHAVPHNVLVLSILEETSHITASYVQWFIGGICIAVLFSIIIYGILRLLFRFENSKIPGDTNYFHNEKKNLGKMSKDEKVMLLIMGIVIVMWTMTTFISIPNLDFYMVANIGTLLLFIVPQNVKTKEGYITIADVKSLNWNIILLITCAVGFSGLIANLGVIAFIGEKLSAFSGMMIMAIASYVTPVMTNFLAGMATATTMGNILIPAAQSVGIDPMIIARIIPSVSIGMMVPWAGTSAAMYFGSNRLDLKYMIKSGIIMTAVLGTICMVGFMILVPALNLSMPL